VWDTEVELGGWVNKDDEEDKKSEMGKEARAMNE